MKLRTMTITQGVVDLLSDAHTSVPTDKCYFFKGDLRQMAQALAVARSLGVKAGVTGGIPYVESQDDFDKVVTYIKLHKVEGYWNY